MNKVKQFFYKYITNPIAWFLDFCNFPKRRRLRERREAIANKNMLDYIDTTSRHILFEEEIQENLNAGRVPHPLALPIIIAHNIDKAHTMFQEKKRNGDFDELNILIK